jgi:hypothetical protein
VSDVRSLFPKAKPTAVAGITAADAALENTLDNLAGAGNYAAWIFEQVEPYLGDEVLEVGAGHGTFTELLSGRSSASHSAAGKPCRGREVLAV